MSFHVLRRVAELGSIIILIGGLVGAASAQTIVDPGQIATCICIQDGMSAASADMAQKTADLSGTRRELADLDREIADRRSRTDVNDPDAIGRFKQLLERRDDVYRRSTGSDMGAADSAVSRYNERVAEFNLRCANRAYDPVVTQRVRATLSCPR